MASKCHFSVTDAGSVAAHEIVQAYIKDFKCTFPRLEEIRDFGKVLSQPGERKALPLKLDKYSVGYFDTSLRPIDLRENQEAVLEVLIGANSPNSRCFIQVGRED